METLIIFATLLLLVIGGAICNFASQRKGVKIAGLISMLIGSIGILILLSGIGKFGEFYTEHKFLLKGLLISTCVTIGFISGFSLYRIIFPDGSHASHFFEEAIIGTLHANYFVTLFLLDKKVKEVGTDYAKGKKLYYELMYGLVGASFIVLTAILPIAAAAGLYLAEKIHFEVGGHDIPAIAVYILAGLIILRITWFWIKTLRSHRYEALPGHELHVYCRTKLMFIKGPTDGDILAPPGFCKAIQRKKFLTIECSAKGLTCANNHERMFVKTKMIARVKIIDTTIVLNNEVSEKMLGEDIVKMMRACFLAEIGKITGEQTVHDKDKLEAEVIAALATEINLRGNGNLLLENLLIQKMRLKPSTLMAA